MSSYLTSVATNFAVKTLTNLVYEGLIDKKDKNKIEEIQGRIITFNRRYDNTVLDSNAFESYLKDNSIDESIFQFVFISFETEFESINDFKIRLAKEAVEFVNDIYSRQGRSAVKDDDIFAEYFDVLIDELINVRANVLSFKDKALVSTIVDEMRKSRDCTAATIRAEISDLKRDNIFAEDIIQEIIDLVNLWEFDSALEKISGILEDSEHLSVNQKEILLFQRARVYIIRKKPKNVIEVRQKIVRLNHNSKYIYEIDFYIARENQDDILYADTIEKMKEFKYSNEKIKLKMVEFKFSGDIFSEIITDLLLEENELKVEFEEYAEAHFYFGLYQIKNRKYSDAKESFDRAYGLRNSVIYRYDSLFSWFYMLHLDIEAKQEQKSEYIELMRELVNELDAIKYIAEEFQINEKSEFWVIYITSTSIFDSNKALDVYKSLDDEIRDTRVIKNAEARLYMQIGAIDKALELFEAMTERTIDVIFQMLQLYTHRKAWKKTTDLIDSLDLEAFKMGEDEEVHFNIELISVFYLLALYKLSSLEMVAKDVEKMLSKTKLEALEHDILVEILKEHKEHILWKQLLISIKNHFNAYYIMEKVTIAEKLIAAFEDELARELLRPTLADSEKLFVIYLATFKTLDVTTNETMDAYKVICEMFDLGYRYKTLLRCKCSFERQMENIVKLYKSLSVYKELFGVDEFYSIYYLEAKLRQRDNSEITEAMEYLQNHGGADSSMLIAHTLANMGQWENAQEIALDTIYHVPELLKEHLINYISFHMKNIDKEKNDVILEQVRDNTVVYMSKVYDNTIPLKDEYGDVNRIIAIHRKIDRVIEPGECKFGCENYTSQNSIGLILISTGYKKEMVTLSDGTYVIDEIVHLHIYVLQKCWAILEEKYPNHNLYQKIETDHIDDMVDKMKKVMSQQDQYRKKKFDMYNFIDNPMGMPVSFLGGKEPTKYVQMLIGLLYYDKQPVYSAEISYHEDENYVVSISSLVLLKELEMLDKLKRINDRVCITTATKSYIERGVGLSNIETVTQAGTMYLTEDNNLSMVEYTDKNKKDWKVYWSKLLLATMELEVIDVEVEDHEMYDISSVWVIDAEIQSIEASRIKNKVLLSDDLFIRKLAMSVDETIKSTNVVGFLLSTGSLEIEEAFEMHLKLSGFKYVYSIDENMLLELYLLVLEKDDDTHWIKFGELVENLLLDEVIEHYHQTIIKFWIKILYKGIVRKQLHDFMWERMGMKPYEELSRILGEMYKAEESPCEI